MLIETAIGDAYGAGFEYVSRRIVREQNNLSRYIQHPRHGTQPGHYTDDTQMSLAMAEAILSDQPWTPELLAEHFVTAFKRDPREGYAGGFHAFLQEIRDGGEFLARIRPTSDKSGAAMRAAPCGVFPSVEEVVDKCTVQARLTHDTPEGIHSACAAALMAHYFLYDLGPKASLGPFLEDHIPSAWAEPWSGKVGPKGAMSVRAAITAIVQHERMSDLLQACIAFEGDVDTVAAIAMGPAAHSREVEQDLPAHLYDALEDGPYGRRYIQNLDKQVLARTRPS